MEKPSSMLQREFKSKIVNAINTSQLPAFVVAMILESALNDVKRIEEMQYAADKEAYEQSLKNDDGEQ